MVHAREDYNRIQDPALIDASLLGEGCSPIAEDEPVFLLRAKDKHFLTILANYLDYVVSDSIMVEAIEAQIIRAKKWQEKNNTKEHDVPNISKKIIIENKKELFYDDEDGEWCDRCGDYFAYDVTK